MKKYSMCLYLFLAVSFCCLIIGYWITVNHQEQDPFAAEIQQETETAAEDYAAANQQAEHQSLPAESYYLVSEDGFLLVFAKDQETICLYTHMPIIDFPMEEQKRLREGIWFSSMMEVFQYLESYTS